MEKKMEGLIRAYLQFIQALFGEGSVGGNVYDP